MSTKHWDEAGNCRTCGECGRCVCPHHKIRCATCKRLTHVTRIKPTQGVNMCHRCAALAVQIRRATTLTQKPCADCETYQPLARLTRSRDGRELCPRCHKRARQKAEENRQRALFCETGSLFEMDTDGRAEALALFG